MSGELPTAASGWWAALGWVDGLMLCVLAGSVLVGVVRGLLFELLSLAGWLVAWFGAQWLAPQLAPLLQPWMPAWASAPASLLGLAFGLAFVGVLLLWSLLARLVRLLVHATPLSLPDRALGALFGALRGGVLLLVLATAVAFTPASQSPDWRASQGARWLGTLLAGLKPLLPAEVARRLPA